MPNSAEFVHPDASTAPSFTIPWWLVIAAWTVAFLMFVYWLIGKLLVLVFAWLAFSSIGGICAAESRKMRRSRH